MVREEFQAGQWQFPFVVYRPEVMSDNLPMIVQLHGAGERGTGYDQLSMMDIHGFSNMLKNGEEYQCIFVMPQCRPESFWVAEILNIYAFIQSVMKHFHADEKKIYLTGLSMGGFGTWYTALRYPKMFAAIAPICGGGMVWHADALDMPIWAFHGTEDETVYPSETINMIHKIRALGVNQNEVKMTILDNVGHDSWVAAYQKELYNWLLSKSR